MDEIEILNKLISEEDTLVKKARGKSPEIYLSELLLAILLTNSGPEASNLLNISPQTFNRLIKVLFPNINLNGGGQTWKSYLLHSIEVHKCTCCKIYKEYSYFYKDKSSSIGVCNTCIECAVSYRNKEYHKIYSKNHYYNNKEYYTFKSAKYKANKLQRIPAWADLRVIEEFYYNKPKNMHVDHIIPLNGKNVSGLHVIDNLQYLSAEDNLKKSNSFIS